MAVCSKHHKELDKNGIGKCSVPMWRNGMPAGFCDKTAYGFSLLHETVRIIMAEKSGLMVDTMAMCFFWLALFMVDQKTRRRLRLSKGM